MNALIALLNFVSPCPDAVRRAIDEGYDYKNSGVIGPKADLTETYLNSANLRFADLSGANLQGAYLSGADLTGANLAKAALIGTPTPAQILASVLAVYLVPSTAMNRFFG